MPEDKNTRYALYAGSGILLTIFIYFALLTDAFYSHGTRNQNIQMAQMAPTLPLLTEIPPEADADIQITSPVNGMKSRSHAVSIQGKAPENAVVALFLNGTLVDSTRVRRSHFRFPQLMLTKPANTLQAKYYAADGSSANSQAIMIFYQDQNASDSSGEIFFRNTSYNISRGSTARKELALTFDGKLETNSAETILDVLNRHNIRATVFLTKEFIEKYPDLAKRVAYRHEVGAQLGPSTIPNWTREEFQGVLQDTAEAFQDTTGHSMARLWRTRAGSTDLQTRLWAAELDYIHVAWTSTPGTNQNMDSLDWATAADGQSYFPAVALRDRLLSFGRNESEQANGAIVLMHLGSKRNKQDRLDQWLPEIIETYRIRGYEFITAGEMIDRKHSTALAAR